MKTVLNGFAAIVTAAMSMACAHAANLLVNGDFETCSLGGWSTFVTADGSLGSPPLPNVVPFNVIGGTSCAAQFNVGQIVFMSDVQAGGGIAQNVLTPTGNAAFHMEFAALNRGPDNLAAGLF